MTHVNAFHSGNVNMSRRVQDHNHSVMGVIDDFVGSIAFIACLVAVFAVIGGVILAIWTAGSMVWEYCTTGAAERKSAKTKADRRAAAIKNGTWVGK